MTVTMRAMLPLSGVRVRVLLDTGPPLPPGTSLANAEMQQQLQRRLELETTQMLSDLGATLLTGTEGEQGPEIVVACWALAQGFLVSTCSEGTRHSHWQVQAQKNQGWFNSCGSHVDHGLCYGPWLRQQRYACCAWSLVCKQEAVHAPTRPKAVTADWVAECSRLASKVAMLSGR